MAKTRSELREVIKQVFEQEFKTLWIYIPFTWWWKENKNIVLTVNVILFLIGFFTVITNFDHNKTVHYALIGYGIVMMIQIATVMIVAVDHIYIGTRMRRILRTLKSKDCELPGINALQAYIKSLNLEAQYIQRRLETFTRKDYLKANVGYLAAFLFFIFAVTACLILGNYIMTGFFALCLVVGIWQFEKSYKSKPGNL